MSDKPSTKKQKSTNWLQKLTSKMKEVPDNKAALELLKKHTEQLRRSPKSPGKSR